MPKDIMIHRPATLKVVDTHLGKSVKAGGHISLGTTILEFKGEKISKDMLPTISLPEDDRFLQIGTNLYLGPSGESDDFINHSCDPNSGVQQQGDKFVLIALTDIKPGEEICFDYSTTMSGEDWTMQCHCRTAQCRRTIGNFEKLPAHLQQKYIALGIAPQHVVKAGTTVNK
jgi:hypothetical protein